MEFVAHCFEIIFAIVGFSIVVFMAVLYAIECYVEIQGEREIKKLMSTTPTDNVRQ